MSDSCSTCDRKNPPSTTGKRKKGSKKSNPECVNWICCDGCSHWFHTSCVNISEVILPALPHLWYFCTDCSAVGSLIPRQSSPQAPPAPDNLKQIAEHIEDLTSKIRQLQSELDSLRSTNKKLIDRLQSRVQEVSGAEERFAVQQKALDDVGRKLEIIEEGAKLARTCSQSVNNFRIAINKIPYRSGENVTTIVKELFGFLGIPALMSHVVKCFRLTVKASKWTDRSLTPTIIVILDDHEARDAVLRQYFRKYNDVKLCQILPELPLDYRFTLNEVLPVTTFRIRNLALRLKHRKLVQSVFVRNGSVSVLLPNQPRYTQVKDIDHLIELTRHVEEANNSSVFFDAVGPDTSFASTSKTH